MIDLVIETKEGAGRDGVYILRPLCLLFPKILAIALLSSSLPLQTCFWAVPLISSILSQG